MQTRFTAAQLADPHLREADRILRTCVHCGFCLSTCPTYTLLGDERDSPRGRIYLMKDMLESGGPARATHVRHIDRCLSCLNCLTACPSGVDYMHLVDQARVHIERTYVRPWPERALRALLAWVLPRPLLFRLSLLLARPVRPFAKLSPGRLARMITTAPSRFDSPSPLEAPQVLRSEGVRRKRVALLIGCVQPVLGGRIHDATVRLLRRFGCDVIIARGAGCCGALPHHIGRADEAKRFARANIAAWMREVDGEGLDAVVINASGCGTTVKDYGHLLGLDPQWAAAARTIAAKAVDVSELLVELGVRAAGPRRITVAYHDSCSLQHGQRVTRPPRALLTAAGFAAREVGEAHMCCGAAGTYNVLQPEIADALGQRKAQHLDAAGADVMACANLGCMVHLARFTDLPMVHTVELLDWATGGPIPPALESVAHAAV